MQFAKRYHTYRPFFQGLITSGGDLQAALKCTRGQPALEHYLDAFSPPPARQQQRISPANYFPARKNHSQHRNYQVKISLPSNIAPEEQRHSENPAEKFPICLTFELKLLPPFLSKEITPIPKFNRWPSAIPSTAAELRRSRHIPSTHSQLTIRRVFSHFSRVKQQKFPTTSRSKRKPGAPQFRLPPGRRENQEHRSSDYLQVEEETTSTAVPTTSRSKRKPRAPQFRPPPGRRENQETQQFRRPAVPTPRVPTSKSSDTRSSDIQEFRHQKFRRPAVPTPVFRRPAVPTPVFRRPAVPTLEFRHPVSRLQPVRQHDTQLHTTDSAEVPHRHALPPDRNLEILVPTYVGSIAEIRT